MPDHPGDPALDAIALVRKALTDAGATADAPDPLVTATASVVIRCALAESAAGVAELAAVVRELFAEALADDGVDRLLDRIEHLQPLPLGEPSRANPLAIASAYEQTQAERPGTVTRASRRKQGGAYGTPAALVEAVLDHTLRPRLDRDDTASSQVTVLDCACGGGAFLLGAHRLAGDRVRLLGIDVDPISVGIARSVLWLARGCLLDDANDLTRQIIVGDTLLDDTLPAWLDRGAGADVVVTNPPWVSHSGRHAQPVSDDIARALGDRFASYRGWPSLHGCFVERCAEMAAPAGTIGLVLPCALAHQAGYGPARAALARACTAVDAFDVGEKVFATHADVTQPTCLVIATRHAITPPEQDGGRDAATEPWELQSMDTSSRDASVSADAAIGARSSPAVPSMPAEGPRLDRHVRDMGIHTGNVGRLIVRRLDDDNKNGGEGGEPPAGWVWVREGRDVRAFALGPPRAWVWAEPDTAALPADAYFRIGSLERFREAPILLRQTAAFPIACRHTEPRAAFRNSVLACWPPEGLTVEAMLALLNSPLWRAWHQAATPDARQRVFPQVKIRHLRTLPLPDKATWPALNEACAKLVPTIEHNLADPSATTSHVREVTRLHESVYQAYELGVKGAGGPRSALPRG